MNKNKTNISVVNAAGIRVNSNIIVGEQGNYSSGDILDANAVEKLIGENIDDLIAAPLYLQGENEIVCIYVLDRVNNTYTVCKNEQVTISTQQGSTVYNTNEKGVALATVPFGVSYTVGVRRKDGFYIIGNKTEVTYTAILSKRIVTFIYNQFKSGVYVFGDDGIDYTPDEFEAALESGEKTENDAKFIKISSTNLAQNGGVFAIKIDDLVNKTYSSLLWCTSNTLFNSIPLNGNDGNANYYYDGLTASTLIKQEAIDNNLSVPAVNHCLAKSIEVGGVSHPGFLGSAGQWSALWSAKNTVDFITELVRDGSYKLSDITANKWTSTQNVATSAYYWTTYVGGNYKNNSYLVVPFFAF